MKVWELALKNIAGNSFRSGVVFLCALFLSGFALGMTLIIRGVLGLIFALAGKGAKGG